MTELVGGVGGVRDRSRRRPRRPGPVPQHGGAARHRALAPSSCSRRAAASKAAAGRVRDVALGAAHARRRRACGSTASPSTSPTSRCPTPACGSGRSCWRPLAELAPDIVAARLGGGASTTSASSASARSTSARAADDLARGRRARPARARQRRGRAVGRRAGRRRAGAARRRAHQGASWPRPPPAGPRAAWPPCSAATPTRPTSTWPTPWPPAPACATSTPCGSWSTRARAASTS